MKYPPDDRAGGIVVLILGILSLLGAIALLIGARTVWEYEFEEPVITLKPLGDVP